MKVIYSKIYKGHDSKVTSNHIAGRKCQTMDVVNDCYVTSLEPFKIYFGLAEGKWMKRYFHYKTSFNHKRYSHETTLSS